MSQINVSGMSLDEFCEILTEKTGLTSEVVEESIKNDAANWLNIDYSSVTYAFVYLSDLFNAYESASDEENDDEMVILDTLRNMNDATGDDGDYLIVFND